MRRNRLLHAFGSSVELSTILFSTALRIKTAAWDIVEQNSLFFLKMRFSVTAFALSVLLGIVNGLPAYGESKNSLQARQDDLVMTIL